MQRRTKRYQFILRTVAPVHIGCGETYTPKEYIYENGQYYFPDMGKLYREIEKTGEATVTMFEGFLMQSGNRDSRHNPRLINFLRDSAIKSRNFGGYAVKETGYEIAETSVNRYGSQVPVPVKTGRLNEVAAFIKDPYGNPYIPGSSLKGAIRTILINEVFKVDNSRNARFAIPWGAQRDRAFSDIFHDIRVSDSQPLPTEKLILAQKWDYSAIKGEARALPIHRESLKPFTEVLFTITAEGEEAISLLDSLGTYAKQHYTHYKTYFLDEFPDRYIQSHIQYPIYLGAGSGVWTKTFIDEAKKNTDSFSRGKMKMVRKGVLKLTKAPNVAFMVKSERKELLSNPDALYEMGKCMFYMKELKEGIKPCKH